MGPRFDRLRYEVFQNLFLSPMNTGSVRPAVATTPTARGIETHELHHLPYRKPSYRVATTPTARGIETHVPMRNEPNLLLQQHLPLAVLKLPFNSNVKLEILAVLQQHLPLAVLKLTILH